MNGYSDIFHEPSSDDEEFAIACGYEVITEEELMSVMWSHKSGGCPPPPSSTKRGPSSFIFSTNKSSSSSSSSGILSSMMMKMMSKPMSSCSLSSQGTETSGVSEFSSQGTETSEASDFSSQVSEYHDDEDDGDEFQLSVERIWYVIQKKRHLHEVEHEVRMAHRQQQFLTMEQNASNNSNKKLTGWFLNLLHLPEKLRQAAADKHRFNLEKVPKKIRDELKHIYVY